jgi:hypothetical protein
MLSLWFRSITELLSRDHLPALILVVVFMMLFLFTYDSRCLNSSHVLSDLIEDGMCIVARSDVAADLHALVVILAHSACLDVRCRFHGLSPLI